RPRRSAGSYLSGALLPTWALRIVGMQLVDGRHWGPRGWGGVALELRSGRTVQLLETSNRTSEGAAAWLRCVDAELAAARGAAGLPPIDPG
ncbi:MAG: hypothetical protein ABMA25_10295, partial [Ilumatobacteraceae bacterium]